jgi:hypothetical protein
LPLDHANFIRKPLIYNQLYQGRRIVGDGAISSVANFRGNNSECRFFALRTRSPQFFPRSNMSPGEATHGRLVDQEMDPFAIEPLPARRPSARKIGLYRAEYPLLHGVLPKALR